MSYSRTRYLDHSAGKQIILPFPEKLLSGLLTKHGFDPEHLDTDSIAIIFPELVGLWFDGDVQTEEFSSIANHFLAMVGHKKGELSGRLLDATELSYYIRNTNKKSGEPLHGFVTRLRQYYEKSNE